MAFKKGDKAKFVIPDIVGRIVAARVNDDAEFLYQLEYEVDGEVHERSFLAHELIPVEDAAAE